MADTPRVTVPVEPTEAMRLVPDRVLTETLYWMARAYERVHSMPRVSDTELANKIEAAKADLGRARDASPILPNSASPAPEGGAVKRACVVFQEAIDDFEADVDDVMAEGSERADLWDREIMVNIDALKTVMNAALATREEAPAEAGEAERIIACHLPLADAPDTVCLPITMTAGDLRTVYAALRAQPQAREEAKPVDGDWQSIAMWMGFAASVIKSGEPWTDQCQREFDEAKAAYARLSATHPAPDALRVAVSDIAAERQRQVDAEGWSADRDDGYADAELAKSAAAYTLSACGFSPDAAREMWPRSWSAHWWKPTTARRDLVKAGALIVAEIERLDRQALAALQAEQGAR